MLAGRPGNAAALAEAGRLFGRLAHLLDAAEDRQQDEAQGLWNPLTVTGTSQQEARRLCQDAVHGIKLALAEVEFTDRALVHRLLAHETGEAVDRVFGRAGHACAHQAPAGSTPTGTGPGGSGAGGSAGPSAPTDPDAPSGPAAPSGPDAPSGPQLPPVPPKPHRGLIAGCAAWLTMACTCQLLCCEHDHPFSRERRKGFCQRNCDSCCDACDCCSGCDGGCCGDDGCCGGCDCCGCDGCGCDCS